MIRIVRSTTLTVFGGLLLSASISACASASDDAAAGDAPKENVKAYPQALLAKPNLAGKTNIAAGRAIVASSAAAGASPSHAVQLGFERKVEAVSVSTSSVLPWGYSRPAQHVQLLDPQGRVVASQTLDPLSTTWMGTFWVTFDKPTAATAIRVVEDGGGMYEGKAYTDVTNIEGYTQLIPEELFPLLSKQPPVSGGTCWKKTQGRGAGKVPTECGAGEEKNGALCYPKCNPGFEGVGPVCWEVCPAGWTNTGAFCHQDANIFSADNGSCPWYDVCGLTFAKGCSHCPSGYTNDGCTCRRDPKDYAKQTTLRGAGTLLKCGAGLEMQAGLCYDACQPGMQGVGPVCWGSCGADHPVDCAGIACATDAAACEYSIKNKTMATVEMIANLSSIALSFGESAEAISIVKAGARALNASDRAIVREAIVQEIRKHAVDIGEDAIQSAATEGLNAVLTGKFDWTAIDPTGIAAVVLAFNQPIC
ncbi:MAG TPA: hypothetical protein VLT33_44010 [Labilithrix sp.]|nr:hypothetical protein [Labilithrix sp.]